VHADLIEARDRMGYRALGEVLAGYGITTVEVEMLNDWYATGPARTQSDAVRRDLLAAGAALGARHVKAGADLDTDRPQRKEPLMADAPLPARLRVAAEWVTGSTYMVLARQTSPEDGLLHYSTAQALARARPGEYVIERSHRERRIRRITGQEAAQRSGGPGPSYLSSGERYPPRPLSRMADDLDSLQRAWLRANLIRLADVAERVDVSPSTISSWRERYAFPEPILPHDRRSTGAVYWWPDIVRFLEENNLPDTRYLTNRPKQTAHRPWTANPQPAAQAGPPSSLAGLEYPAAAAVPRADPDRQPRRAPQPALRPTRKASPASQ